MSEDNPPSDIFEDAAETSSSAPDTPEWDERDSGTQGAVPPGYDWPTHGGYLGCFLGIMVSCLIGGFLGSTFFAALRYQHILPGIVAALLTVVLYVVLIYAIGRLGWVLGKRFFREYPQDRGPTWGENDEAAQRIEDERLIVRRARQNEGEAATQAADAPAEDGEDQRDGDG